MYEGRVCAWQSATQLGISCKSVQPVPARVEEPVSLVWQLYRSGALNPFQERVGCQNWHTNNASAYFAEGGGQYQ